MGENHAFELSLVLFNYHGVLGVSFVYFFFSHATLGLYKKLHNRAPKALNRLVNLSSFFVDLSFHFTFMYPTYCEFINMQVGDVWAG